MWCDNMRHFDTMLSKQFTTNKFASMALRWIGFATHDSNLVTSSIRVNQTLQSCFKNRNFCHFLIVKIAVLVIAIIVQGPSSNNIPHIIVSYIGVFKQLFNHSTIKMGSPF